MEDRGQYQEEGEDETAGRGDERNAEVSADKGQSNSLSKLYLKQSQVWLSLSLSLIFRGSWSSVWSFSELPRYLTSLLAQVIYQLTNFADCLISQAMAAPGINMTKAGIGNVEQDKNVY